jgi:two-component system phosphate regulon response regulator PhoB
MEKPKILYAEDEKMLSDLYLNRFSLEDWEVFHAKNGNEAVLLAKQHQPHIMVFDIMMPDKDGLEALRELKREPRFFNTPVIMLSVLPTEEVINKSMESGASEYLVKSQITPAKVVDTINKYVKK